MPKISLIMPVYNSSKTLDYSVDSVINQTEKDFEFIAIDDGSIDDSLNKLEKLKDKSNINFKIYHKENGGVASARKYGLEKSNSEIVGFIDSDDKIDKTYLQKTYETLAKTNANICCSRMAFHLNYPIIDNIPFKNKKRNLSYYTLFDKKIVPIINVSTNGKLFKRYYINIADNGFVANEDLSQNYYIYAKAEHISFANDITYHYIPNNEGLVSQNINGYKWKQIKNTLLPLSELKKNFENDNLLTEYYSELEQLFIKNIFQRVDFIKKNIPETSNKSILINTLYDYISHHFPNWQENSYLLSNFNDFEFNDIISAYQNKKSIKNYTPTSYEKEQEIFDKYENVSNEISILTKKLK